MSNWPAAKSKRVFATLLRVGWQIKRRHGSHLIIERVGWPDYVWAFHDNDFKLQNPTTP